MRKTKIVCTLGPSTDKDGILEELVKNGMDVARFNFSHQDHAGHLHRLEQLQEVRERLGKPVAALLDTKGPEIRVKKFKDGKVSLKKGQEFTFTTRDILGTGSEVSVTFPDFAKDINVGNRILVDDGLVAMKCVSVTDTEVVCKVENDGVISDSKGINVPDIDLSIPYISQKDREDIIFGIEHGFDFIAASFVRSSGDVLQIRRILEEHNCNSINIIAKIENMQGVNNIDEIIQVSDGIMVARGDMGVEVPYEDVPVYQKMIIKKVYNAGKQVITATQMLDSMMKNPRPTRAETTDVANAIYDGTSAIMLSGETAAGLYPVQSLQTMVRIAVRAEHDIDYTKRFFNRERKCNSHVTDAISHATCTTAHDLNAKAIITVTKSGSTARMVSKYRPNVDIYGCSPSASVCRQLNMSWGVTPVLVEEEQETLELFSHCATKVAEKGKLKQGDLMVITAGVPLGISGTSNIIKVHQVGNQYYL